MIAPAIVDEVKRLLNKGKLSQRNVALRTGVSRTTVGAIASGKRPEREASALGDELEQRAVGIAEVIDGSARRSERKQQAIRDRLERRRVALARAREQLEQRTAALVEVVTAQRAAVDDVDLVRLFELADLS